MKYIYLFCGLFILSSCSFSLNGAKDDEARCLGYKNNIEDQITNEATLLINPDSDHQYFMNLKEIFYSPVLKSCLYVKKIYLMDGVTVKEDYVVSDYYKAVDIKTFNIIEQRQNTGKLIDFEEYIKSLKF